MLVRDGCARMFHFGYIEAELEMAPNKKTKSVVIFVAVR